MTDRLFGQLKQGLEGLLYHSNEKMEMAVHQASQMQLPDFCCNGIFKFVPE
jgi:hypothetical protein